MTALLEYLIDLTVQNVTVLLELLEYFTDYIKGECSIRVFLHKGNWTFS